MDLKSIAHSLFTKNNYSEILDEDKEQFFFIMNRYMSKKYPMHAHRFNNKYQDKATAMDIWYLFLKQEKNIPYWFWKGPAKMIEPSIKDWKLLYEYDLDTNDILFLCDTNPEIVKEEIDYLKQYLKEKDERPV